MAFCAVGSAHAQTVTLTWNGDSRSTVTGYRVSVDGTNTDHGATPFRADGTCGCSVPLNLNGGRHTLIVTAYNSSGQSASAPLVVAPTANAGGPYAGQIGTAISVSGGSSDAPTGSLRTYSWRWGDGTADTSSASPSASHAYATAGTFTLTLTVTDNAGATASATTTATITSSASPLPAPWQTQDVGSVGRAGSASHANGEFTVAGAGADIGGGGDAFHYVYRTLSGDGQIVARVTGIRTRTRSPKPA